VLGNLAKHAAYTGSRVDGHFVGHYEPGKRRLLLTDAAAIKAAPWPIPFAHTSCRGRLRPEFAIAISLHSCYHIISH
jgi:hypothetical protein